MKARTPLILLSLAANLALAAVLLWRTAVSYPPAQALPPASIPSSSRPPAPSGPLAPGPKTWSQLAAASDAELVARLRAEGFPSKMIFALALLRVEERHAEALRKFRPPADYAYWRKSFYEEDLSPEDRAARRALNRQMAEERKQLLGADTDLTSLDERANRQRLYGDLPAEKADQLSAINKDYSDIAAWVRDRAKGVILPEDREQLAAIEREKRADLTALLTPQELLEYDLRSSPSAATVRQQTRNFEPTEEEYRALTHLQLAFDATYGNRTNLSAAQEQRRTEATAELTAQIKALLPPERYAEYEIKTDQTYASIAGMVARYHSPADATAVVSAQQDLARRFNALRNDRALAPTVRDAQLNALSAEANTRMEAALGPDAFKMFKSNGGPINALLNRPAHQP